MGNRLVEAATGCSQRVSSTVGRTEAETRNTTQAEAVLMTGMAETLGLDPADIRRQLGPETYQEMTAQCQGCTKHDRCVLWLVDHAPGAAQPPDFCVNGEHWEALRHPRTIP